MPAMDMPAMDMPAMDVPTMDVPTMDMGASIRTRGKAWRMPSSM
jgi:hypothetical protein